MTVETNLKHDERTAIGVSTLTEAENLSALHAMNLYKKAQQYLGPSHFTKTCKSNVDAGTSTESANPRRHSKKASAHSMTIKDWLKHEKENYDQLLKSIPQGKFLENANTNAAFNDDTLKQTPSAMIDRSIARMELSNHECSSRPNQLADLDINSKSPEASSRYSSFRPKHINTLHSTNVTERLDQVSRQTHPHHQSYPPHVYLTHESGQDSVQKGSLKERIVRGYKGISPLNADEFELQTNQSFIRPPSFPLGPPPSLRSCKVQPRVLIPNNLPSLLRDNPTVPIPQQLTHFTTSEFTPQIKITPQGLMPQYHHPQTQFKSAAIDPAAALSQRHIIAESIKDLKRSLRRKVETPLPTDQYIDNLIENRDRSPQFYPHLRNSHQSLPVMRSDLVPILGEIDSCPNLPSHGLLFPKIDNVQSMQRHSQIQMEPNKRTEGSQLNKASGRKEDHSLPMSHSWTCTHTRIPYPKLQKKQVTRETLPTYPKKRQESSEILDVKKINLQKERTFKNAKDLTRNVANEKKRLQDKREYSLGRMQKASEDIINNNNNYNAPKISHPQPMSQSMISKPPKKRAVPSSKSFFVNRTIKERKMAFETRQRLKRYQSGYNMHTFRNDRRNNNATTVNKVFGTPSTSATSTFQTIPHRQWL